MPYARITVALLSAVALFCVSFGAGKYFSGVVPEDILAMRESSWISTPAPVDYSNSADRFASDLANLEIFSAKERSSNPSIFGNELLREAEPRLIALGSLDGDRVVIVSEGDNAAFRMKVGEVSPSGWRLREIGSESVIFFRHGNELHLELF